MPNQQIAEIPTVEPSSEPFPRTEPQAEGSAIAVVPPAITKAKRKHRRTATLPEGLPDATTQPAAEEAKPPLPAEEIAAACRTMLLDYLAGTGGMSTAEAGAAVDRAVRALASPPASVVHDDSKLARLTALLRRREGATIAEMVAATGWQAHSVRGALSGTLKKRMGLAVTSEAAEGGRVYRVPAEG